MGGNQLRKIIVPYDVDLIPSSSWYTNVRNVVDPVDWERLKEMSKRRAMYRCEICGAEQDNRQNTFLECHERYLFDKESKTQRIIRFMCICSPCHRVTHFGLAHVNGKSEQALKHLMKINKWDENRANEHISNRFKLWEVKSDMEWVIDLSILESIGISQVNYIQ